MKKGYVHTLNEDTQAYDVFYPITSASRVIADESTYDSLGDKLEEVDESLIAASETLNTQKDALLEGTHLKPIISQLKDEVNNNKLDILGGQDQHMRSLMYDVANLNLQIQASKRVPGGTTFGVRFGASDVQNNMQIDTTSTRITSPSVAGARTVQVIYGGAFTVGTEVTLYDSRLILERAIIESKTGNTITFTKPLENAYTLFAYVARSTGRPDETTNEYTFGRWDEYEDYGPVDTIVRPTRRAITAGVGKKLLFLPNGWIVTSSVNFNDDPTDRRELVLSISKDNGATFSEHKTFGAVTTSPNYSYLQSMVAVDDQIYIICHNFPDVVILRFNTVTNDWEPGTTVVLATGSACQSLDIEYHAQTRVLTAAWVNQPVGGGAYNVFMQEWVVSPDHQLATYAPVSNLTNLTAAASESATDVSIISDSVEGQHIITYIYKKSSTWSVVWFDKKTWTQRTITSSSLALTTPNIVTIPPRWVDNVNSLWVVVYGGRLVAGGELIVFSRMSIDNGVTWIGEQTMPGTSPMISATSTGEIILTRLDFPSGGSVRNIIRSWYSVISNYWSDDAPLTNFTSATTITMNVLVNPEYLYRMPPLIYQETSTNSLHFVGTWSKLIQKDLLDTDIRFRIVNTDEIALYADTTLDPIDSCHFNNQPMTVTKSGNTSQAIISTDEVQSGDVRITMKRPNASVKSSVKTILGGYHRSTIN